MAQKNANLMALLLLLSAALSLNACAAEPKKAAGKSVALSGEYVWHDGDREQRVWLNPQILAEFNPDRKGERSIKSASAAAKIVQTKRKQPAIRLWQIDGTAESTIRTLKSSHPQGKYSVVFHDGPSGGSRMRALPGNIIVYLDPQWDEAKVTSWLNSRKLEVVKKLEIGPNIFVIKTGPGLEALDAANALYRTGEVKAAFPDWWQETTTR